MDTAGGMDWQAKRIEGKIFTVRYIDSAGQIHLEETGLALIPGVDEYEVVGRTLWEKGQGDLFLFDDVIRDPFFVQFCCTVVAPDFHSCRLWRSFKVVLIGRGGTFFASIDVLFDFVSPYLLM